MNHKQITIDNMFEKKIIRPSTLSGLSKNKPQDSMIYLTYSKKFTCVQSKEVSLLPLISKSNKFVTFQFKGQCYMSPA